MILPVDNEIAMNVLDTEYFYNHYSETEWMNTQTLKEKTRALIKCDRYLQRAEEDNIMLASRARRASIFNKMLALWGGRK